MEKYGPEERKQALLMPGIVLVKASLRQNIEGRGDEKASEGQGQVLENRVQKRRGKEIKETKGGEKRIKRKERML